MTNAQDLLLNPGLRIMVVGYPGTAKTGGLASLLNAGFKMRILDFDGNIDPLLQYADKAMLKNLDVAYFEDKMRKGTGLIEPAGIPQAFASAWSQLDDWKTKDARGADISLGNSREWGPDTIVVLDSLTKMGDAAFRRAMKMLNKTPMNITQRVWGMAMQEQMAFIEALTSASNKHHVIVLAHLKMIGPKTVDEDESGINKTIMQEAADLTPTRLWPRALGRELPQQIGAEFPILIEATVTERNGRAIRALNLVPRTSLDVKFPGAKDFPTSLPIEDGMLRVFKALSPGSVKLVQQKEGIDA